MMEWAIGSVLAAASAPDTATWITPQRNPAPDTVSGDAFAALMRTGVSELNASVGAAEGAMRELAAGKGVELHDVMITLERAQLSVQTFVQIRNKLVESYQDLTRMQL
jgi:flagellar hook-basal body complex protein FliE